MSQFDAFARFYDLDYGAYQDDLHLYLEFAGRAPGPVLELMCGTGRVALPLAEAGFEVLGIDVSPAMLEIARRRAAAAGLGGKAQFQLGDARTLDLGRTFGLTIVAINSLMHLETSEDQLAALSAIARHMEYRSLLLIDLFNPHAEHLTSLEGHLVLDRNLRDPETGHTVQKLVARRVDLAEQIIDVTFLYDEIAADGTLRRHMPPPFAMRWLYRAEAEHLLARAGLELEGIFGSYELEPYTSSSERLILLAHRA